MKIKDSFGDRVFMGINLAVVIFLLVIVVYPLILVLSSSVSTPEAVGRGEVLLLPVGFTLDGYRRVFDEPTVWIGYRNTLFYTFFGTMVNIFLTLPAAYALSKRALPGRAFLMGFFLVTMYFSGGMIPAFMLVRALGLIDTRTIMVISGAVSVYNLIVARTFFVNIPKELEEAAYIDGCSILRGFTQIVLPLSKALLGVMVLFYAVAHWNSFFTALIYITSEDLRPLQIVLRRILIIDTQAMDMVGGDDIAQEIEALRQLVRYSIIVVSSVPVLVLYPWLQKYFEKGVLIGSVKG